MSRHSMSSLIKNLEDRTVKEQKQIEELMSNRLKELSANLKKSVKKELNIIHGFMVGTRNKPGKVIRLTLEMDRALEQIHQKHVNLKIRSWIKPTLAGLFLSLGIFIGSWGLSTYMAKDITMKIQYLQSLKQEISSQEEILAHLTSKTWGVRLHQSHNGRFLILPKGTDLETIWKAGENPALKLSGN